MKIEKKAKGKGKGKATISIALAAIMLASVMAAMVTPAVVAIDTESPAEDVTVQAAAIDVEASPTTQVVGNDVLIITTAGAGVRVVVQIAAGPATFDTTKGDYPTRALAGSTATTFVGTMPSDGTLVLVMTSTTTGGVTVRAGIDANGNGAIDAGEVTDTVDVTFKKSTTTVEVPAKFTIGKVITISGMTNAGVDEVAIFINDVLRKRAPVRADDTYEWEWHTGAHATPNPGSVTIKVFEIHTVATAASADLIEGIGEGLDVGCGGKGFPDLDGDGVVNTFYDTTLGAPTRRHEDASTTTLAVEGELAATMDALRVAKGDDIVAKGTAAGEYMVRGILIAEDGTALCDLFESVLEDDTFEFTSPTTTTWPTGTYKILVISDGRDDSTLLTGGGDISGAGGVGGVGIGPQSTTRLTAAGATLRGILVIALTQSQIIAIIEDLINSPGSDDKMVILSFRVENPSIELEAIEPVAVGEPLNICGTANREPGTKIVIWAIEGPEELVDKKPSTETMIGVSTYEAAWVRFVRDARTVNDASGAPPVAIGELVRLTGPDGVLGTADDPTTLQKLEGTPPVPVGMIITATGAGFDTAGASPGTYQSDQNTRVTLVEPVLDVKLQIGTLEVSSVVIGQRIDVVVDTNIPGAAGAVPPAVPAGPNALKLKIFDKKDGVYTTAGIGVPAAGAPAGTMWSVTTGVGGLPTGDYIFTVETYTTGAAVASIDIKSTAKDMTVRKLTLNVEADVSEQVVGNDIVITTTAGAGVGVTITLAGATGVFDPNKGDYPDRALAGSTATTFIATIPSDGTLTAVITSTTPGVVTVRAWITADPTVTDTIEVRFRKSRTTVETSITKFTIGDKVTIRGMTDSGVDEIAIFINDILRRRAPVRADDTYEWEWDTGLVATPKPGLVTIKVFEIHTVATAASADLIEGIGEGLDVGCGGKGLPDIDGDGVVNTFYDTTLGAPTRRHEDASTLIVAVDSELPPLLPSVITEVEWPTADTGVFSATIDTTNAIPGTYTIEARDGDGNCDTVTVEIVKGKTTVSISTDKTSYTMGNTMHVGLGITNPGDALPVRFAVWLEQPSGGIIVVTYTSVTLPAGLDYSNPHFMVFRLPRMPAGIYRWHAALIKPSGPVEIISHDTAEWKFVSTRAPTEDIARTLEQTTVVIDFSE